MSQSLDKVSKFLSLVLRHQPEAIGINLDSEGWVEIENLIYQAGINGTKLDLSLIEQVVSTSDKKRFTLSECKRKIRAAQGHSTSQVQIKFKALVPPEYLYHGTAVRFLESIKIEGLDPKGRHHVHLSSDTETAASVGNRYGKAIVLKIHSKLMHENGYEFYQSENGVWLTHQVPIKYIDFSS